MMTDVKKLMVVVPCYNEEAVLHETLRRLTEVLQGVRHKYEGQIVPSILFVDDGSRDATWQLISQFQQESSLVGGLRLAHNAGHQHALWAGLEFAADHADAAISIDADLQDDVNVSADMAEQWWKGTDIVYGVRKDRPTDTAFKKHTAQAFYHLMARMGGDIVYNHADYRLMSRRALVALMQYPERNIFLRGMVRTLGFNEGYAYYDRSERFAGESKYPFRKMLSFAIDGITSFSVKPLQMITYLGIFLTFASFVAILYALVSWAAGKALPGWTSLLISLWFIGGAILISLGVIGTYVGKIYSEVKRRPRYIVDKVLEPADAR